MGIVLLINLISFVFPIFFKNYIPYLTLAYAILAFIMVMLFPYEALSLVTLAIGFYLLGVVLAKSMVTNEATVHDVLTRYATPDNVDRIEEKVLLNEETSASK